MDKPTLARAQGFRWTSALHPALLSPCQPTGPVMPVGPQSGARCPHAPIEPMCSEGRHVPRGLQRRELVAQWMGGLGCWYPWVTRSGEQGLTLASEDWGHESGRDMGRRVNLKELFMLEYPGVRSLHCPWCSPSPGCQPFSHFMAPQCLPWRACEKPANILGFLWPVQTVVWGERSCNPRF